MSKQASKIRKISENVLLTACVAAVPVLCFFGTVLNYQTPPNNDKELHQQRENLYYAEVNYFDTRDKVIEQSKDTLKQDKVYLQLLQNIDSVGYYAGYTDEYYSLIDRADSVAEHLRSEYINNNTELNNAGEWLTCSYARLDQMRRDSTVRDSIMRIPTKQRFSTNWVAMRTEWHNMMIQHHQNKLQKLQQKQK